MKICVGIEWCRLRHPVRRPPILLSRADNLRGRRHGIQAKIFLRGFLKNTFPLRKILNLDPVSTAVKIQRFID